MRRRSRSFAEAAGGAPAGLSLGRQLRQITYRLIVARPRRSCRMRRGQKPSMPLRVFALSRKTRGWMRHPRRSLSSVCAPTLMTVRRPVARVWFVPSSAGGRSGTRSGPFIGASDGQEKDPRTRRSSASRYDVRGSSSTPSPRPIDDTATSETQAQISIQHSLRGHR
jgi:hypothetical protein